MKRLSLVLLAVLLAACTAAPTQAPVQPVAQEPVVVTVVVQPTQAPPQQEPIVVTVVVPASPVPAQPTAVPPTQAPAAAPAADTSSASLVLDDLLGKGVFKSITLSGNEFSLRCVTREITITATASLIDIEEAELFYRTVDQPGALYYSAWQSAGKMEEEGSGLFSMVLTGEDVHPNLRLDPGWFEFQIVGLNRGGGRVDATEKIEQLVTYRINCP